MPTRRRTLLPFLLLAHAAVARAQGVEGAEGAAVALWPTRPLRLVVPFAPGGVTDRLGRMLAESLAPRLGQPVQVENLAGAGTVVGARAAAAAAPDGHTLLLATLTMLAINPALHRGALPYDPVRDFAPVALVAAVPFVLVARRADGPESLAALLAAVRRGAGRLGLRLGRAGRAHHLGMEMLRPQAGVADGRTCRTAAARRRCRICLAGGSRRWWRSWRSRCRTCATARSARSPSPRRGACPNCRRCRRWRRPPASRTTS